MRAMEVRQLQSHMQSDPGRFWLPQQLATDGKLMGRAEPLVQASLLTPISQVFARLILGLCGREVVFQEAL